MVVAVEAEDAGKQLRSVAYKFNAKDAGASKRRQNVRHGCRKTFLSFLRQRITISLFLSNFEKERKKNWLKVLLSSSSWVGVVSSQHTQRPSCFGDVTVLTSDDVSL